MITITGISEVPKSKINQIFIPFAEPFEARLSDSDLLELFIKLPDYNKVNGAVVWKLDFTTSWTSVDLNFYDYRPVDIEIKRL